VYNGSANHAIAYFTNLGFDIPQYGNPAEYLLEILSSNVQGMTVGFKFFENDSDDDMNLYKNKG